MFCSNRIERLAHQRSLLHIGEMFFLAILLFTLEFRMSRTNVDAVKPLKTFSNSSNLDGRKINREIKTSQQPIRVGTKQGIYEITL